MNYTIFKDGEKNLEYLVLEGQDFKLTCHLYNCVDHSHYRSLKYNSCFDDEKLFIIGQFGIIIDEYELKERLSNGKNIYQKVKTKSDIRDDRINNLFE